MDMPPQVAVEYRVAPVKAERPRSLHAQIARFMGSERIRVEQTAGITIGSFDAARKLPPMDFNSSKLTQAERQGMAIVVGASHEGRLGTTAFSIPDGYVARRMAAAVLTARLAERSQNGLDVSAKQIDAVRCRLVAVVMDPRAGQYVKGGERVAAASRAALSKGDVELCSGSIAEQAARISDQKRASVQSGFAKRVAVSPTISKGGIPVLTPTDVERRIQAIRNAAQGMRGGR